jgi:hypothetical protein
MAQVERQLCLAVSQRAFDDGMAEFHGGPKSTFGRHDFLASGSPRASNDLELGWRVATAVLDNAWREIGGLDLRYVEEPFAGRIVMAPEPLGPFFLSSQNIRSIIVWGNHLVFEYGDRVVTFDLEKRGINVT